MNTRQAENEIAFERLETNLAQRDATNLKMDHWIWYCVGGYRSWWDENNK